MTHTVSLLWAFHEFCNWHGELDVSYLGDHLMSSPCSARSELTVSLLWPNWVSLKWAHHEIIDSFITDTKRLHFTIRKHLSPFISGISSRTELPFFFQYCLDDANFGTKKAKKLAFTNFLWVNNHKKRIRVTWGNMGEYEHFDNHDLYLSSNTSYNVLSAFFKYRIVIWFYHIFR